MNKIIDNDYYDLLVDNINLSSGGFSSNIININERFSLLNVSVDNMGACALGEYPYNLFPHLYTLTSLIAAESSGVTAVQRNPYLGLYGRGVIIGILSIWDQTIQDGIFLKACSTEHRVQQRTAQ